MKTRRRIVGALGSLALLLATALFACSGAPSASGIEEPVRLRGATFEEGPLPLAGLTTPIITALEVPSTTIEPGQTARSLVGRASPDAFAIGVRFADLGSGYWVFPTEGPDPQNHGELGWTTVADFPTGLPTGPRTLLVAAIDASGHAGPARELSLCLAPPVPDNGNACDRTKTPPSAVLSLSWDTAADVDLVVITPDGRQVDAKHPRTVAPPPPGPSTGVDAGAAASAGAIDRDSNRSCVIDNVRREDLVFPVRPAAGSSYLVYASLFDACRTSVVHFELALYEATPDETDPKLQRLVRSIDKHGVLLPLEASGGATLGTFVTEVSF
ncbi:MAG: hypothetical protein JWP97_5342 [Labilithrix sp.]|nr:hypothetical protein [Labilithrix sp.]